MRLIVPNGSCGGIIGKGGATIRCHSFSLSNCRAYLFSMYLKLLPIKVVFAILILVVVHYTLCSGNMFRLQGVVSYMNAASLVSELLFSSGPCFPSSEKKHVIVRSTTIFHCMILSLCF